MKIKLINFLKYGKWTSCKHRSWPWDWQPLDGWKKEDVVLPALVRWQCPDCGVIK